MLRYQHPLTVTPDSGHSTPLVAMGTCMSGRRGELISASQHTTGVTHVRTHLPSLEKAICLSIIELSLVEDFPGVNALTESHPRGVGLSMKTVPFGR